MFTLRIKMQMIKVKYEIVIACTAEFIKLTKIDCSQRLLSSMKFRREYIAAIMK